MLVMGLFHYPGKRSDNYALVRQCRQQNRDDAFALHPEWRGYGMSYSEWRAEDRVSRPQKL
jgi:hypothetical protein